MPVTYDVEITLAAERDVEAIWDYLSVDSPGNATAFIVRLDDQIATLERVPERCSLILENELLGTSYRQLLFGAYRTIFRITGKSVYILRIIHGARLIHVSCFDPVRP